MARRVMEAVAEDCLWSQFSLKGKKKKKGTQHHKGLCSYESGHDWVNAGGNCCQKVEKGIEAHTRYAHQRQNRKKQPEDEEHGERAKTVSRRGTRRRSSWIRTRFDLEVGK